MTLRNSHVGETLFIRYHNASEMNHNIVIVKSEEDINPVGIAALSAQADDFVPQNLNPKAYFSQEQDRILAASTLAYPGDTVVIEFTPHLVLEPTPTSAPTLNPFHHDAGPYSCRAVMRWRRFRS